MMNPSFSLTLNLTIPNADALLFTLMCLREKLSRHVGSKRSPLAPLFPEGPWQHAVVPVIREL